MSHQILTWMVIWRRRRRVVVVVHVAHVGNEICVHGAGERSEG
jgi:hypothetical protein